jgi:hypothetical protein
MHMCCLLAVRPLHFIQHSPELCQQNLCDTVLCLYSLTCTTHALQYNSAEAHQIQLLLVAAHHQTQLVRRQLQYSHGLATVQLLNCSIKGCHQWCPEQRSELCWQCSCCRFGDSPPAGSRLATLTVVVVMCVYVSPAFA